MEIAHDQHFLQDTSILEVIIPAAELHKSDTVLEIGPGYGILTKELVKKAAKVIAIEIDEQFADALSKYKKVELLIGNALDILPQRDDFTKIVAAIPYQICEPLMQYLCLAKQVELSVLIVPMKFALRVQQHPLFSAFLTLEVIQEVPKEAFSPAPKVVSAVVKITPNKEDRDDLFIIRKLYWQRTKKLKNGLRDTLIDFYERKGKKLSKKGALDLILKMDLDDVLLELLIAKLPLERYGEIVGKVKGRV